MKRIPSSFQLGSYTITVKLLDEDAFKRRKIGTNVYGVFDPNCLTIYLLKLKRDKASKQILFQTFWHEYTHALLWVSLPKYYTNEKLVDNIGHHLAQLHTTATYDN